MIATLIWQAKSTWRFVDRTEFLSLISSRRQLSRVNIHAAGVVLLLDSDSGECFLIERVASAVA